MLQHVTWLAIIAVHTSQNEPPKVRQAMNTIDRNIGAHRRPREDRPDRPRLAVVLRLFLRPHGSKGY